MKRAIWFVFLCVIGVQLSQAGNPELWHSFKIDPTEPEYMHSDNYVVFSPDSKMLASAWMGTVRLLSIAKEKETITLPGDTYGRYSLAFSPDGKILAGGCHCEKIWLWDTTSRKEIASFDTGPTFHRPGPRVPLAFIPSGKTLVWWSRDSSDEVSAATFWDVATQRETDSVKLKTGLTVRVEISPNCKIAATTDCGGTIQLWDITTGKHLKSLKGKSVRSSRMTFSPDNKLLAVADDSNVVIWDIAAGKMTFVFKAKGYRVFPVAFSPDGSLLASGSSPSPIIELWDVSSGKKVATIKGHNEDSDSLSFSQDGRFLASGDMGGMVEIWNLKPIKEEVSTEVINPPPP